MGKHEFAYAIYPHAGESVQPAAWFGQAARFNVPPVFLRRRSRSNP